MAGVGFVNQEPYNEVAATELHRRLMRSSEFTPYRLFEDTRRVYCACDNLLGPDEELISAWDAIRNVKQPNNLSDMRPADQVRLFEGCFGWLDPASLEGYPERVAEILSANPNITERRIATVKDNVRMNAKLLVRIAK